MANEIRLPHGKIECLVKMFSKSRPFIRKVLRGNDSDDLSKKIRFTAINHFGGYEIKKVNMK